MHLYGNLYLTTCIYWKKASQKSFSHIYYYFFIMWINKCPSLNLVVHLTNNENKRAKRLPENNVITRQLLNYFYRFMMPSNNKKT